MTSSSRASAGIDSMRSSAGISARTSTTGSLAREGSGRAPTSARNAFTVSRRASSFRISCALFLFLFSFLLTACTGSPTERHDQSVVGVNAESVVAKTQTGASTTAKMQDDRSGKLRAITLGWKTDWTRHSVPYEEVRWGGPKRDESPSIDDPHFISTTVSVWIFAGGFPSEK